MGGVEGLRVLPIVKSAFPLAGAKGKGMEKKDGEKSKKGRRCIEKQLRTAGLGRGQEKSDGEEKGVPRLFSGQHAKWRRLLGENLKCKIKQIEKKGTSC